MEVPFQYGRLAEAGSFIDRIDDRRELKNFLSHGINTILVSRRRWGKSSLVKESMKELVEEEKNIKVCFLDAYKIHTEEEFYNKFASAIIQGVFQNELDELVPSQIALLKAIASGETHFNAKGVVEKYRLGQSQTITRNKKTLVEKDLVEKKQRCLLLCGSVV